MLEISVFCVLTERGDHLCAVYDAPRIDVSSKVVTQWIKYILNFPSVSGNIYTDWPSIKTTLRYEIRETSEIIRKVDTAGEREQRQVFCGSSTTLKKAVDLGLTNKRRKYFSWERNIIVLFVVY